MLTGWLQISVSWQTTPTRWCHCRGWCRRDTVKPSMSRDSWNHSLIFCDRERKNFRNRFVTNMLVLRYGLQCCWLGDRKGIRPVKVLPQQCSWLTITAWWQQADFSQEHCYCHRREAPLKLEDMAGYEVITVFLTPGGSVWSNTSVLWHEPKSDMVVETRNGIRPVKSSSTAVAKSFLLGIGLTWNNSVKWAVK